MRFVHIELSTLEVSKSPIYLRRNANREKVRRSNGLYLRLSVRRLPSCHDRSAFSTFTYPALVKNQNRASRLQVGGFLSSRVAGHIIALPACTLVVRMIRIHTKILFSTRHNDCTPRPGNLSVDISRSSERREKQNICAIFQICVESYVTKGKSVKLQQKTSNHQWPRKAGWWGLKQVV